MSNNITIFDYKRMKLRKIIEPYKIQVLLKTISVEMLRYITKLVCSCLSIILKKSK